jgi:spore maturation protein CgeB
MGNECHRLSEAIFLKMQESRDFSSDRVTAIHYLEEAQKKLGMSAGDQRSRFLDFLQIGLNRFAQRALVVENLIPLGQSLRLYGGGWGVVEDFKRFSHHRVLPGAELAKLYRRSRVNIHTNGDTNVHWRVFECIAAGGFILVMAHKTDRQPGGLNDFLEIGREVITFDTPEDLRENVIYYLDHPDERYEIIERGRKRVLAEHTYAARSELIIRDLHGVVKNSAGMGAQVCEDQKRGSGRSGEIWGIARDSSITGYLAAFRHLGHPVRELLREEVENLDTLGSVPPACVLDINFNPRTQDRLTSAGIPYIGINWDVWYTSPRLPPKWEDYRPSLLSFCFTCDPNQIPALRERVGHVEHLPLGCDLEHFRPMTAELSEADRKRYGDRISFVGTPLLWNSCDGYYTFQEKMNKKRLTADPDEARFLYLARRMLDDVIETQRQDLFRYRLPEILSDFERRYQIHLISSDWSLPKESAAIYLSVHISMLQRIETVKALAPLGISVWGPEEWKEIAVPGVRYRGHADHLTEIPKIINATDVNINLTKCHSEDALGPRVFEVLACGGFLLTNRNKALAHFFEEGKDVVVFESLEDLKEKARYYLDHPAERHAIAERGCHKVRERHGILHRTQHIQRVLIERRILAERTQANLRTS